MAIRDRRARIERVVKMIESARKGGKDSLDSVKFVALCSYNIGVSTQKIVEYLSMIAGLGVIRIDWRKGLIYFEERV